MADMEMLKLRQAERLTAHDAVKRAEARVTRWKSAMPSPDLLAQAAPGMAAHEWKPVQGPHLRCIRSRDSRSRTGVVGVSLARGRTRGGIERTYYCAQCGPTCRKFCIETLGRREAFRRALALRAAHEIKVRRANAVILRARMAQEGCEAEGALS